MSALGHKRTFAVHKLMSALPPIATAKADIRKRSCLLYPQKRTFERLWVVSFGGVDVGRRPAVLAILDADVAGPRPAPQVEFLATTKLDLVARKHGQSVSTCSRTSR